MKKILVVGSGGREAAVVDALLRSNGVSEVFVAPGNGWLEGKADVTCVKIGVMEFEKLVEFALEKGVNLAVVASDDPLVGGLVDAFKSAGVRAFGPEKKAAIIEGSKAFSKNLMQRYGIPTAGFSVFESAKSAREFLEKANFPQVIKADGLALGKGVVIAQNFKEAEAALNSLTAKFGEKIVIEEFMEGVEVSVLAFTDGKTIRPMVTAMDHKRIGEGDTGENTGGMGTVAPNPFYTKEVASECMERIFLPTVAAMNAENRTFKGCLFFGLMITKDGAKVVEYNCRFGDPETQVVLPLLKGDFLEILESVVDERLSEVSVEFLPKSACCVVVASGGYPGEFERGFEVELPLVKDGEFLFGAGLKRENGVLKTSGGRVVGCVCVRETLNDAVGGALELAKKVKFSGAYFRRDIGAKALKKEQK